MRLPHFFLQNVRHTHYSELCSEEPSVPTVHRIGKLLIQLFADDHAPPHFHVDAPNGKAMVRIDTLEIHRGSLTRRDYEAARDWASQNRELLINEWNRLNER